MYVITETTPIAVNLTKNDKFLINIVSSKGTKNIKDKICMLSLLNIIYF